MKKHTGGRSLKFGPSRSQATRPSFRPAPGAKLSKADRRELRDADPARPLLADQVLAFRDKACTVCKEGLVLVHDKPDDAGRVEPCTACAQPRFVQVHAQHVITVSGRVYWRRSYVPPGGNPGEAFPVQNLERQMPTPPLPEKSAADFNRIIAEGEPVPEGQPTACCGRFHDPDDKPAEPPTQSLYELRFVFHGEERTVTAPIEGATTDAEAVAWVHAHSRTIPPPPHPDETLLRVVEVATGREVAVLHPDNLEFAK